MRQPLDIANRQRALDPGQSFCVRAPAGSGKTELLTQRVLVLLARIQRPEEILCITFTRKAAAEMRDRILKSLRKAQQSEPPQVAHERHTWELARAALANDQEQQWHLLQNPARLQIMTIDALCAGLTRRLPLQAGFGLQPDICPDAQSLYQQAVERLLMHLEGDDPIAEPLGRLLLHLDNNLDRVEPLLISMLGKREQWLPLIGSGEQIRQARQLLESALDQLRQDELLSLRQQLTLFGSDLAGLLDYAAENLAEDSSLACCRGIDELPGTANEDLPQWRALTDLLLTAQGQWRKQVTVRNGFPAGSTKDEKALAKARKQELLELIANLSELPGLLERLQRLLLLPSSHYADTQWHILDALTQVLPRLVAELWLCFSEQNQVDYSELTRGALTALGDEQLPTDLMLLLDYRLSHILVDEFQDTAAPQISLLQKLTYGWQSGDGRTLFIVGDGMQSCYGFRNANVGLFLNARREGIGSVSLQSADLSVNFRSQQQLVGWVNQIFRGAFPAEDDICRGAVSYSDSDSFNPPLDGEAVKLHGLVDYPTSDSAAAAEADLIVDLIRHTRTEHPQDSIAVLVRNRSHLRAILPALQQAGFTWLATDLDPLATRMWVQDLLSLARAFSSPADRIAWLALLRAPWCGLDNADLLALAGLEHRRTPILTRLEQLLTLQDASDENSRALSPDGLSRLQRFYSVLSNAWQQRQRRSLRESLELCWLRLGGAAGLDSAQRRDIDRALELISQHERAGRIADWSQLERDLGKLYAQPASDADPKLQIMTIHKSKGLEFDHVILAGLHRTPRADDKALLQWHERLNTKGELELLMAPLAADSDDEDPIYRYLSSEASARDRMESVRLLYVGATRAIKRLHLSSCFSSDNKGTLKSPAKNSLLAGIWLQVKDLFDCYQAPENLKTHTPVRSLHKLRRLPLDWQIPQPMDENLLPSPQRRELDEGDNLPETDWLQAPRLAGTLVHQVFKQLAEAPLPNLNTLQAQREQWRVQLQQLGLGSDELEQALVRVERLLVQTLEDPTGRWLLDCRHPDSACELPLSYYNGFKTQHFVVDRTFVGDQGERWIIDYKTAACPEELDFSQFIEQESDRYRQQLQNYANCFRAMEKRPIRAALYFPESCHLTEIKLLV